MSDALIKKLNAISHGNLSDPMVVRMADWNEAMDEVRTVLDDLTAAKAEIERLRVQLNCFLSFSTDKEREAFVLRKQAESIERFGQEIGVFDSEYDDQEYVEIPRREIKAYAQRLRTQAEAAEKGGDDA